VKLFMETPWYTMETLWSFVCVCPRGMKIPLSVSHGISWSLHGKFHVFPWNSMGIKPGPSILQDRPTI